MAFTDAGAVRVSGTRQTLKSIKSNLLAFAILATLIPSVGLGLLSFLRYQDVINDNARQELRAAARDASGELTQWLRERVYELRAVAAANTLSEGLGAGDRVSASTRIGPQDLAVYLRSVDDKLDPVLELMLFDASGAAIAGSGATPGPVVRPSTWSAAAATDGIVVAPPRFDPAHATATVTVAVPVLSPRNETIGALAAVLDLSAVQSRLQGGALPSQVELVLLATDGTPLVSNRGPIADLKPLDPTALTLLRAQPGEPMTLIGLRQRDALVVADAPRGLSLVVVAERDHAEMFAAWLQLLQLFVLLVAGLMLLVGVVAYWMGRSIVTPLNALTAAAGDVARGKRSTPLRDESADEIGRLTRVFNLMLERLRRSHADVEAANRALRDQNELLETLATTDSLTGLSNRKQFDHRLTVQFARFCDDRVPFALLMIDIDNLKAIHADYGRVAGDEVVRKVAAILHQNVRPADQVARFGGESFVALLPDVPVDAAMDIAERIRSVVDAPGLLVGKQTTAVTVSIGVAQSRDGDDSPETIVFRADHALHEAQRAGGNRVHSAM